MFELSIQEYISSAHFLRQYEGKCKNLHGHNWKVEAIVCGDKLDGIGMLVDFGVLKESLKKVVSSLDHICLNDLDCFKDINPTSENIARYIYSAFSKEVGPLKVKNIRLWESETSSVSYWE